MNPFRRWKRWRAEIATAKVSAKRAKMPLREFVYLDEVSLRSLLSSQKGEITDTTSQQLADTVLAEAGGKAAVDAQFAKAELTSRFQTTNSSTLQTSKKATVQSWFRELHSLPGLRLIEPGADPRAAMTVEALLETQDLSVLSPAARLCRGELVEFRVKLSADPVFHLGTLVSEFSGMADDFPDLFSAQNADKTLREILPINKILQRLLAGLIPACLSFRRSRRLIAILPFRLSRWFSNATRPASSMSRSSRSTGDAPTCHSASSWGMSV